MSLFAIPFVGPGTGLLGILLIGAAFSIGNALSGPSLVSLASKSARASEQGTILGVTQSVASLGRAVGPSIAAFLIYSAIAHAGFDRQVHHMSDRSILRTFLAAALIQFVGFLLAVYFARRFTGETSEDSVAEAA